MNLSFQTLPIFTEFFSISTQSGRPTNHQSSLNDVGRIEYLHSYIAAVLNSVRCVICLKILLKTQILNVIQFFFWCCRNGSETRGYFQWSFMDLFELMEPNYTYGLYYVNFSDPERKRSPKTSALWYFCFLNGMTNCSQELSASSSPGLFSAQWNRIDRVILYCVFHSLAFCLVV